MANSWICKTEIITPGKENKEGRSNDKKRFIVVRVRAFVVAHTSVLGFEIFVNDRELGYNVLFILQYLLNFNTNLAQILNHMNPRTVLSEILEFIFEHDKWILYACYTVVIPCLITTATAYEIPAIIEIAFKLVT